MKHITDILNESRGDTIDAQWINDEKPVITKDGRQVIITKVDIKEFPNVIYGQVKMKDKLFDFEWLDDGTCRKACDLIGNPKQPNESDNLVKGV